MFNKQKFGPWYWWTFEQWTNKNLEARRQLYGEDPYVYPSGPYNTIREESAIVGQQIIASPVTRVAVRSPAQVVTATPATTVTAVI